MTTIVKKIALIAILTALALIIFIIEAQIPIPVPIPGVKLGLANAVTLFALFYGKSSQKDKTTAAKTGTNETNGNQTLTTIDAFTILLCRITLGAVFTGRLVAFAYSLTGGLLGFLAQVIIKRFVSDKQIWVCGTVGAVFHNIGQMIAAIIITGTPAIAVYLPILVITGIVTGILTGLVAQLTLQRLSKYKNS